MILLLPLSLFLLTTVNAQCVIVGRVSFDMDVASTGCLEPQATSLCSLDADVDRIATNSQSLNLTIIAMQGNVAALFLAFDDIAEQKVLNGSTSWLPCNVSICSLPGQLLAVQANVTVLQALYGVADATLLANSAAITTEENNRISADNYLQQEINLLTNQTTITGDTPWAPCNDTICILAAIVQTDTVSIQNAIYGVACSGTGLPKLVCYIDSDGDGFGNSQGFPFYTCATTCPSGYVNNNKDCDDADATIYPGSTVCRTHPGAPLRAVSAPRTDLPATAQACGLANSVQWGAGLSLNAHTMLASAPCMNVAMAWNWNAPTNDWIPETVFLSPSSAHAAKFGTTVSLSLPYALITQQSADGTSVPAFTLWKRSAINSWTQVVSLSTVVTTTVNASSGLQYPGVRFGAQIANNRTVAGAYMGGTAGAASLGLIGASDSYTEWDLCSCAVRCPVGWSTVLSGAPTLCTALGLGTRALAIDRLDGGYAVVGDASDNLYFFQFNTGDSSWHYVTTKTDAGTAGASVSYAMYAGVFAMGANNVSATSPAVPVDGTTCTGARTGYVVLYNLTAINTWLLYSQQISYPRSCDDDWCGSTVALGPSGLLLVGCSGHGVHAGFAFTKTLSHLQYPVLQQVYQAPPLDAETASYFGSGALDVTSEFIAMAAPSRTENGFAQAGELFVTECSEVITCASGTGGTNNLPPQTADVRVINGYSQVLWIEARTGANGAPLPGQTTVVRSVQPGSYLDYTIPKEGLASCRFWAKYGCNANGTNCTIGDQMQYWPNPPGGCPTPNGCTPPVDSLFEATFGCWGVGTNCSTNPSTGLPLGSTTFFDTSQVDGWTFPYRLTLLGDTAHCDCDGLGNCAGLTTIDGSRLNLADCPTTEYLAYNGTFVVNDGAGHSYNLTSVDLRVFDADHTMVVGCMSPCKRLNYPFPYGMGQNEDISPTEWFCCPTPPISPAQCRSGPVVSTLYVTEVHALAPGVYAYAYDDVNGLHTCNAGSVLYQLEFAPPGSPTYPILL